MGYFGSAFSSTGNGLYVGTSNGGYTGVGSSSSSSSYSSSRVTSKVGSYLKTEYASNIDKAEKYLQDGDFDKAMAQIDKLREYAQEYADEMGYELDDDKLTTALARAGADFSDYADESEEYHGSFVTGLANGIPGVGLLFNSYSEGEVDAKLNGEEVRTSDVIAETVGKAISGGVTGFVLSGFNPIGAVAGIGVAFLQNHIKEWAMQS